MITRPPALLLAMMMFISPMSALADCANPAGVAGVLLYNADFNTMQYCDGTDWIRIPGAGLDCPVGDTIIMASSGWSCGSYGGGGGCTAPSGCANVGDTCADGSVFAGCAPNSVAPLFTTRCDPGRTWGGSSCSGTRVTKGWNNGNSTGNTSTNVTGWGDGSANMATLITLDSNSGAGGTQPHQAAQYCADLNMHGQTDWYLPAAAELIMLYINRAAIGDFDTASGSWYWSSTEQAQSKARYADFYTGASAGDQRNDDKVSFNYLRCIRK